jgi:hypothetical protein
LAGGFDIDRCCLGQSGANFLKLSGSVTSVAQLESYVVLHSFQERSENGHLHITCGTTKNESNEFWRVPVLA